VIIMFDRLGLALQQNPSLSVILEQFDEIVLPDAWLVAGSIAQTVWNMVCGRPSAIVAG
jgi:hypothetical protein